MHRILSSSRTLAVLLIVSLAFNAGFGATYAVRTYNDYCRRSEGEPRYCLPVIDEQLGISRDQRERMQAAREVLLGDVATIQRELAQERHALTDLLAVTEPDRAAVSAQLDKIAALQQRVQRRFVEHLLEEKGQLDPLHREGFSAIIREHICPRECSYRVGIPVPCEGHER
ncbi:MAG: periplasmic heavy metal sensor [Planctomycetota bacterium]